MRGLPNEERQRLGALLEHASQEEVMARIPQFSQAEVHNLAPVSPQARLDLGVLVFNMERGVCLEELGDFLEDCPAVRPFDVILANELDDGCVRSGGKNTTLELAERLGMNAVFGLEFIELVNGEDPKGFHGNAIFSRWPVKRAKVVRLPEQYNWYFDRQRRIGGRLAILAELDAAGKSIGVGTIHLENRTHGPGRRAQLEAVLREAEAMFPGMPVVLGGDLNTNTFDGRDKDAIQAVAGSAELQRRCLEDVAAWEECLPAAEAAGYRLLPERAVPTRRKPLPGGGHLDLRLDWLLVRGLEAKESRTISTRKADCGFARPGSALAAFTGEELSDHNAVWASCALE
ncbi:endonuclease/exonuclease/phosphatase family protein [uncultured Oscillibacter sp.]|jgi:endonuclease/exonuclease/phosphatase family metal-dependent hydrolase|uniref:endonuclease/exonuclease/phosphatase family protein n=1 Tax=uncultured Oscillibacter sp. TaxID=876091 RepID=UPI002612C2A6|nr:endonuclease/exonuclease/phosphatase family protein [uncultured Oscillibacter sp.]